MTTRKINLSATEQPEAALSTANVKEHTFENILLSAHRGKSARPFLIGQSKKRFVKYLSRHPDSSRQIFEP